MNFFNNYNILLFLKFFWWGLVLGLGLILVDVIVRLTRKNVYIYNLITFCFWIVFGGIYVTFCLNFYNYSFCWFGLLGMMLGAFIVQISLKFLFTIFVKLLYNKFAKSRRRKTDGKLRSSQKG